MRYRLQRHDGTDCSATMVPITVLRMVPIQRYRQLTILKFRTFNKTATLLIIKQLLVLNYNANIIEYKEKKKKFQ